MSDRVDSTHERAPAEPPGFDRDGLLRRRRWRLAVVVVALLLCGFAQWHVRHHLWLEVSRQGSVTRCVELGWLNCASSTVRLGNWVLVGAAFIAAVLLGRPAAGPPGAATAPTGREPRRDRLGLWVAALGLGLAGACSYFLTVAWHRSFDTAAPLAVGGVFLWSLGLLLRDRRRFPQPPFRMPRWQVLLLVAVVGLGFFMRFYRFGDYPPPNGVCAVEEPMTGQHSFLLTQHSTRPWEFVGDRWLPVPFFQAFGRSMTTLRLPFALVSALTVPVFYLLLRLLVSVPVALWTTALFAVCTWNLVYARLAHNIFATTLVVVAVLAMCVRCHVRRGLAWYPCVGFLSAYTLYSYAGYRGTPLLVGLFLGLSVLVHVRQWWSSTDVEGRERARARLRTQAAGLVLTVIGFAILFLPLRARLQRNPTHFLEALERSTLMNPAFRGNSVEQTVVRVKTRLQQTASMFNHFGDPSETFNLPWQPMLDPVLGVLFLVGLLHCVFFWRYRWQGFFAFAFLFLLLMGTTFVQNFDVRRLQGMLPFLFVLIALAAERFRALTETCVRGRSGPLLIGLGCVVGVSVFSLNYDLFFRRLIDDPDVRGAFYNDYTLALGYMSEMRGDADLLVVTDATNLFMPSDYQWLLRPDVAGAVSADLWPLFNGSHRFGNAREIHVLLQNPYEREGIAALLQQRLIGTRCEELRHPDVPSRKHMTVCRIPLPLRQRRFPGGVRARYYIGDASRPMLERIEPAVSFAFMPAACRFPAARPTRLCRGEWEGKWIVRADDAYDVFAEVRNGELSVRVDGRLLPTQGHPGGDQRVTARLPLRAGEHDVLLQAKFSSVERNGVRLRVRRVGSTRYEFVKFGHVDSSTSAVGFARD